jgi:hypothetical protein
MAVAIRADVPGRLRSAAGQVVMLHITAADAGRATEAVRAALPEISGLAPADTPAVLMGPFRLPDGCLLLADFEAVTEPEQWLPGHPDRAAVENEARRLTGTR